jgi:transposase
MWKDRDPEKPADIPSKIKHSTIECLYHRGREAVEIIKLAGFRPHTVYDAIKRFQQSSSSAKRSKNSGRPTTVVTKENIKRVRFLIWRDSEVPMAEIGSRLNIDRVSSGWYVSM